MFLVSECTSHGTKVTTDNASARIYRDLVEDCREQSAVDPQHAAWHRAEGTDCWACCAFIRVARDWEQAD